MRFFQFLTLCVSFAATAACSGNAASDKNASNDSTAVSGTSSESKTAYSDRIAFVRMDSLMQGYGLYIDKSDEFGKKQQKIQAELTAKGRSLERELREYQEKAQKGYVTTYQAKITEEGLQKKEREIVAYRDRVLNEMAQEEAAMSAEIIGEVMSYIEQYNKSKGYAMILQTGGNNPVLVADPALDITTEILSELNKRYEAKLASKSGDNK